MEVQFTTSAINGCGETSTDVIYLEHSDLLHPVQVFALHYIYLPQINQALQQFVEAWNNHGVRSEHGQTPNQIFTNVGVSFNDEGIQISPLNLDITDNQMAEIQSIDSLSDSDDFLCGFVYASAGNVTISETDTEQ